MQLYEGFGPTEMSGFKLYHVFLPIGFTKIQYYEEFLTSKWRANIGITVNCDNFEASGCTPRDRGLPEAATTPKKVPFWRR